MDTALELAAGTGIWTSELLKIAAHVMCIDASPEVLAINRQKQGASANVTFEQTDLFSWEPTRQFDLVSLTFWLSHVPPSMVKEFLVKVYRATKPGGTVFMADSRRTSTSTAPDQSDHGTDIYQRRILKDGRTFEIMKIYYEVEELAGLFQDAGFAAQSEETPTYFVYVVAKR